MRADHGSGNFRMPLKSMHGTNIITVFKKMGSEGRSKAWVEAGAAISAAITAFLIARCSARSWVRQRRTKVGLEASKEGRTD